jgi:DNA-binding LacI/PurR family transcriptional regulator
MLIAVAPINKAKQASLMRPPKLKPPPPLRTTPSNIRPASQKEIAQALGLNPATVSVVLNDTPGRSIPQATRDRIKAAAVRMGYMPNLLARSLRSRKTHTIGILVPELGDGYHTQVMGGVGDFLMREGYFYFTVHHRHRPELIQEYIQMLLGRGAEALIAIDTKLESQLPVPVAVVAGHRQIAGVTNIQIDHKIAAQLSLRHLYDLGHRKIAFIRGQPFSSDSTNRWNSTLQVAKQLGLVMDPELIAQLDRDITSPELGYPVVRQLLSTGKRFTAIVSFNDMTAIGAMRCLMDAGLRVPDDVSIIGFDDIKLSAHTSPSLTTVRQPLADMGMIAAKTVLERLHGSPFLKRVVIEPELVIRESTGPAPRR